MADGDGIPGGDRAKERKGEREEDERARESGPVLTQTGWALVAKPSKPVRLVLVDHSPFKSNPNSNNLKSSPKL